MSKFQIGSKILGFEIFPPDGEGTPLDFSLQTNGINFYEDVTDTSVHLEVGIIDVFGRYNKLPVRSGNKVVIEIESNGETIKQEMKISNITAYVATAKREMYNIICESQSAFDNHTTRITKKYTGNISDNIVSIVNDMGGEMIVNDSSSNTLAFCGGYRRPLLACTWLAKKCINGDMSETKGSAGFLFFQTQDGFNLLDIDKTFDAADKDNVINYEYQIGKNTLDVSNYYTLSAQPTLSVNHNLLQQLSVGHFKTANWHYDIITRKATFVEYSYRDSQGQMKSSADENIIPDGIDNNYSRLLLQITDNGAMAPSGDSKTKNEESYFRQAQSTSRYASLFSQITKVVVPTNLNLRAGMIIFLKLPEINSTYTTGPQSGLYMISKLCHQFGGDKDYTGLELVRDSYQELS
tara:strand:- start:23779 stop:25002 length:1224 start_codon:yes stop_codon:yes gene_type:complete